VKYGSVLRLTSTASRKASPNENGGYRCISLSDAACTLNPPQRTRQQALRDAPVSTHLVKRRYFATTIQPSVWRKLLRLRQSMRGPFSTPPDPDRLLAQPANVHSLHGTKRTSPAARIAQQSSRKKSRLSATARIATIGVGSLAPPLSCRRKAQPPEKAHLHGAREAIRPCFAIISKLSLSSAGPGNTHPKIFRSAITLEPVSRRQGSRKPSPCSAAAEISQLCPILSASASSERHSTSGSRIVSPSADLGPADRATRVLRLIPKSLTLSPSSAI